MKDLIHSVVPAGDFYKCARCGIAIPIADVLRAGGDDIVDIAGLHETFLPMEASTPGASILCSHPSAAKQEETIERIRKADDTIRLTEEQEKGDKPGGNWVKTDLEKMVATRGYQNFWMEREMNRPEDYNEVT